jgi:hypothetical protein
MQTTALLALLLTSNLAAGMQDSVWKDEHGKPVPDTDWQKSVSGFGGMLIATPDKDWEAKWKTSPETAPNFATSDKVALGGELTILAFFTNPQPDAAGLGSVSVDIDVKRPDGSVSSHAEGATCFRGKIEGPAENVYLCATTASFIGEATDPAGVWSVQVTLKDDIRKVSVPLATKFELVKEKKTR